MKTPRRIVILQYSVLSFLAVLFLLPFYVIVRNALSTSGVIVSAQWHWLPDNVGGSTLRSIVSNDSVALLPSMAHSAIVAIVQTLGVVVLSMLAGYGLARFRSRISSIVLGLTLFTLMVPATITFVPAFVMVSSLGWISSYRGLVIPMLFSAFATYLFRSHFMTFPRELEEAAFLDGANYWTMFWRIVAPNSLGIVAAVGTITFIGSWNGFLWPMLIGQDDATRTVQVSLSRYLTSSNVKFPEVFAGAMLSIIPVLIVFLFLQRWLVKGIETSGIK